MTRISALALTLCLAPLAFAAQIAPQPKAPAPKAAAAPPDTSLHQLPVRQVILYKNGVGYFQHTGQVTGNQQVSIDFTSAQLNDVLQSLTVLDLGGGRIAGVNYNSTTPLAEQLKALSLGMSDDPTSTELFQALRGQRVEVTGAPGGPISGRLMSIETRNTPTDNSADGTSRPPQERYFLTVISTTGQVRVIELTPALSVRPTDHSLQSEMDRYLEMLAGNHATGLRHLTLNALGAGQRSLAVSYISEVPVWKSTYRIVFPKEATGQAIVQGWAVVDNTVGSDWDNVQLSLVAGAPQSFIQPLSQPLYLRRPEIPISTTAMTTPQTHEAATAGMVSGISGRVADQTGAVIPNASVTATNTATNQSFTTTSGADGTYTFSGLPTGQYSLRINSPGFITTVNTVQVTDSNLAQLNNTLNVGSTAETVTVTSDQVQSLPLNHRSYGKMAKLSAGVAAPPPYPGGGGGGNYPLDSNAVSQFDKIELSAKLLAANAATDVSTSAFDDFFQYDLTQPVTIHKNESAMVPILQQNLPAEHVTLWSEKEPLPFRAIWLENSSKLTLDGGSFSVFSNSTFAGEGLLDPIHPGEKRLLSYAADQAIRVRIPSTGSERTLREIRIGSHGLLTRRWAAQSRQTFEVSNNGDDPRTVVLELPRHPNRTLPPSLKPAETAPGLYRFRLAVEPHKSATLPFAEEGFDQQASQLSADQDQSDFLEQVIREALDRGPSHSPAPESEAAELVSKLRSIARAQKGIQELKNKLSDLSDKEDQLTEDESRARDNLTALKGNDAARRFIDALNRAEDALDANRKDTTDLTAQLKSATDKLQVTIETLSLDWTQPATTPQ